MTQCDPSALFRVPSFEIARFQKPPVLKPELLYGALGDMRSVLAALAINKKFPKHKIRKRDYRLCPGTFRAAGPKIKKFQGFLIRRRKSYCNVICGECPENFRDFIQELMIRSHSGKADNERHVRKVSTRMLLSTCTQESQLRVGSHPAHASIIEKSEAIILREEACSCAPQEHSEF